MQSSPSHLCEGKSFLRPLSEQKLVHISENQRHDRPLDTFDGNLPVHRCWHCCRWLPSDRKEGGQGLVELGLSAMELLVEHGSLEGLVVPSAAWVA